MEITYEDFRKVQIHVGTVLSVKNNEKARQPALVLEVDFGTEIGIKISSAKITHYYNPENQQLIADTDSRFWCHYCYLGMIGGSRNHHILLHYHLTE